MALPCPTMGRALLQQGSFRTWNIFGFDLVGVGVGVNDVSSIFIHVSNPSVEVNEQPVQKLVSCTNPIVLRGGGFLALAFTF